MKHIFFSGFRFFLLLFFFPQNTFMIWPVKRRHWTLIVLLVELSRRLQPPRSQVQLQLSICRWDGCGSVTGYVGLNTGGGRGVVGNIQNGGCTLAHSEFPKY